jgi:hypothetical protein
VRLVSQVSQQMIVANEDSSTVRTLESCILRYRVWMFCGFMTTQILWIAECSRADFTWVPDLGVRIVRSLVVPNMSQQWKRDFSQTECLLEC